METPTPVVFFPPHGTMLFRCVPCLLLILLSSLKATRGLLEMVAEQWLCPYTGLGNITLPSTVSGVCCTGAHVAVLVPDRCLLTPSRPHTGRVSKACALLPLLCSLYCFDREEKEGVAESRASVPPLEITLGTETPAKPP